MNNGRRPKSNTLLNLSSFQILTMFRRGLFYSYLSIYLRFFLGLSVTETTLFATLPMVLNIVFQRFVWGILSDKYQKRRTLIILGEVLAAVGTALVWYFHKVPVSKHAAGYVIIVGLSLVEIFWSMSNIGWSAIISDLYPDEERTGVQGRLSSLGALGRMAGVLIGGFAYDGLARYYEGWGFDQGFLFFVASATMLISTIPMFFVPEGGVKTEKTEHTDTRVDVKEAYRVFTIFLIAMIFINFGRNSIAVIKAQYLSLDTGFNVSSQLLGYIVNMQSLGIFIFGLFITRLSRRYRDVNLLYVGTLIAIISLMGFAFASHLAVIFVSNLLAGVSMVVILAASYSYASRLIPPAHRGKQFAWFNATFFLSWGVAGTLIAGPLIDILLRTGASQVFAYRISFVSSAALVVVGLIILYTVERMNSRLLARKHPH
ncbi:MAG: MFS transporter [candidate division WOR-3 bacterium]|nr:MAG: MFS transporter [candidate division WOR-3 bacterium]